LCPNDPNRVANSQWLQNAIDWFFGEHSRLPGYMMGTPFGGVISSLDQSSENYSRGENTLGTLDALVAAGVTAGIVLTVDGAVPAAEEPIPSTIYRGATPGNPAHVALREGEEAVSFRDSMSNPLPEPGDPPQPVLRPGRNYIEVDTSKLPPGTVVPDGGTVVNGQLMPPGHVSVTATPEQIVNATTGGGKFPK
jgi:hypothetical protein